MSTRPHIRDPWKSHHLQGAKSLLAVICFLPVFPLTNFSAECLTNGDFSQVLAHWKMSTALGDDLPYIDPEECVSTGDSGYLPADILQQPLSVDNIAGHTFTVSAEIGVISAESSGQSSLGLYLDYLTDTGALERVLVVNPNDASIPASNPIDPTQFASFSGTHTFPADADRLVGLTIGRSDSTWTEFYLDNLSVSCPTRTPGQVPFITTGSLPAFAYGDILILEGSGFGSSGQLSIGGNQAGVSVTEWTPTRIQATIQTPCKGGEIELDANGSKNWQKREVRISSPYFIATVSPPTSNPHSPGSGNEGSQIVVPGQVVKIPIDIAFQKGYTTTGIHLSVSERSTFAEFNPSVLIQAGGSVLEYDTSGLPAGNYTCEILAQDEVGSQIIGTAEFDVRVVDRVEVMIDGSPIPDPMTTPKWQICTVSIYDTQNREISNEIPVPEWSSTYRGAVEIFRDQPDEPWGDYYLLPHMSGSATLTATFPDGTEFDFPITVDLSQSPDIHLQWMNPVITNEPSEDVKNKLFVNTSHAMTSIGWSTSGIGLRGGDSDWGSGNLSWYKDYYLDDNSWLPTPGTRLLRVGADVATASGTEYVSDGVLLHIVNDPAAGMITGDVFIISSDFFETSGTLELYNPDDLTTPVDSFDIWVWSSQYTAPRVAPGTYLVRFYNDMLGEEMWFPSASSPEDASPVTVEAGGTVADINFIFGPTFDETPPEVVAAPTVGGGDSGDEFSYEIMTESGKSYLIQKSYTLEEGSWFTIGSIWGSGDPKPVVDTMNSNDRAFYRVVEE